MTNGNASVTDSAVGELQAALVKAVLGMEALPGYEQPIVLPDLSFVTRRGAPLLLDENLRGDADEELQGTARVITRAELLTVDGEAAGLRFDEPEVRAASVSFRLWVVLAHQDGQIAAMSGVLVSFVHEGGEWVVRDEPLVFAS